jgi:hypothetical protein
MSDARILVLKDALTLLLFDVTSDMISPARSGSDAILAHSVLFKR